MWKASWEFDFPEVSVNTRTGSSWNYTSFNKKWKEEKIRWYTTENWKGDSIEKKDNNAFIFSLDVALFAVVVIVVALIIIVVVIIVDLIILVTVAVIVIVLIIPVVVIVLLLILVFFCCILFCLLALLFHHYQQDLPILPPYFGLLHAYLQIALLELITHCLLVVENIGHSDLDYFVLLVLVFHVFICHYSGYEISSSLSPMFILYSHNFDFHLFLALDFP